MFLSEYLMLIEVLSLYYGELFICASQNIDIDKIINIILITFHFNRFSISAMWNKTLCISDLLLCYGVAAPTWEDYQQFFHKSQLQRNKIGFTDPLLHPGY